MRHALKHIHFVGVGGAGMSGIAEVLHSQGYRVSGSDAHDSATLRRLAALGLRVHVGHAAAQLGDADVLVASSAIAADNPELVAARERGVPVVPRAVMLAELMRAQKGVAIAGTHGKTTTTSLVTSVLVEAGMDPSFVIGGQLQSAGAHARLGRGEFIVVEADESDASFLHLHPVLAVVTNIDADHMDTYGHSLARLDQAFVDFLHRLPFYGRAVMCGDDAGVQRIAAQVQRPLALYGLGEGRLPRAREVAAIDGGQMRFVAQRADGLPDLPVTLNLAGMHNVRNALAAIAVADELEIAGEITARALAGFGGVGRRFQRHGELAAADGGSFTLIDDYGHHPAELAAVLAARGAFARRRLVVAFQPHRFTRTRDCFAEFARVLAEADAVLLADIYAAGEAPIAGISSAALAARVRGARSVGAVEALVPAIREIARDGDVVITLGAGSIAELPGLLKGGAR